MNVPWERAERVGTYVVLAALVVGSLLGNLIPAFNTVFQSGAQVALLGTALLLVFRLIVRHLERTTAPLAAVQFPDGISMFVKGVRRREDVMLMANDGSKYFHFVAEQQVYFRTLRILLTDTAQADKWKSLQDRGFVEVVEVKVADAPTLTHFMISRSRGGVIGFFRRTGPTVWARDNFFVSGDSSTGRALLKALANMFESAWASGVDVYAVPQVPADKSSN